MNNPGGDDGDGTVRVPICPYCKKKKMFFDYYEMVSHIAQHEGGERKIVDELKRK